MDEDIDDLDEPLEDVEDLEVQVCKRLNFPFANYASIPVNNNLKSRLCVKFLYICCIFSHEASTLGYCLQELKCNSEMGYCFHF